MKKITLMLTIVLLLLSSQAHACLVSEPAGNALFQVFNRFFYAANDEGRMGSNTELLNSAYFLPDGLDMLFGKPGDVLRIDLTFRNDLFGHELGYMAGDTYHTLVNHNATGNGRISEQGTLFTMTDRFTFTDTLMLGGYALQRWYADPTLNAFGNKDHFLSFAIEDDTLLEVFNRKYGTQYSAGLDDVWMIAFESLNLGNADFNDLVAVVSRPSALNAVPVPGAALLMLSGLTVAVGGRLRRRMK